ncbi:hypothetical protein ACHAXN_002763 [Cyclotella atomus]
MSDALAPFQASRTSRLAHISRSHTLLSILTGPPKPTILTLPNLEDESSSRPTSTFVIRPLSTAERSALESNSCQITENADVRIMYRVAGNGEGSTMINWDVSSSICQQVRNCTLGHKVILGVLLDGPDVNTANNGRIGVSNVGYVENCILEPGCCVVDTTEVLDTHVMKYAVIKGCGSISCSKEVIKSAKKCNFDIVNGTMDVEVGPEAGGGRVINVKIESTLVDVCHDLQMDINGGTIAPLVNFDTTATSTIPSPSAMNLLCPHSSILHTPQVNHVHLCQHSTINSATSVTSSLLLPQSTIQHGSTVSHALLQWQSKITSQSDAHHVFLMECSEIGPHSFTANTIYGPDSHVSGGEVHCTLFGPNANSHHQSLLIGILWALGRGNVGYGSNVGSNHTGRIPDQETSVGEGTFWGLGCVIKFPVDLTCAPYTIIAAGVQLPPQRIQLPFSLITDGPGGMNQLTPGWLLQYSPYTIARSEVKFANRRTAKRHDYYTGWKILRPGMMDLLMKARGSLMSVERQQQQQSSGEGKVKSVFKTDRDIVGLGANALTEKGRQIGIRAYTDAIQRYALRGLLERLVKLIRDDKNVSYDDLLAHAGLVGVNVNVVDAAASSCNSKVDWPVLPWNEPSHANDAELWKHQHSVLLKEIPSIVKGGTNDNDNVLSQLLQKCIALEDDHAKRVYKSKSRDDSRGASTVPGYKDSHIPAEKDSVVLAAKEEAGEVKKEVEMVLAACGASGAVRSRL